MRILQHSNHMPQPYIINISSDEDDDDVEVLEFRKQTQELISRAPPKVVKKLSDAECPICFDAITNATTTLCGHVYCLECLQRSISSSLARGQTRGRKGVGLCPMCRKSVAFKDAIVLRMKAGKPVAPPAEEPEKDTHADESHESDDFLGLF